MAAKPTTIDECLAPLSDDKKAALEKLRKNIQAAAPKAEECISYGLAAFRLEGKPLVAFGATANHCAFYLMCSSTLDTFQEDLKGYDLSKGTIRFSANKPLPAVLVKKLVKARIAENESLRGEAARPKAPAKRRAAKPNALDSRTDPAVLEFLAKLEHPLKKEIDSLRRLILDVSPEIREGIKWNSPSFRTSEYFATINLRAQDRLQLILHLGAKVKEIPSSGLQIADPAGLLEWLAKDRCLVTIHSAKEIKDSKSALQAILKEWIGTL